MGKLTIEGRHDQWISDVNEDEIKMVNRIMDHLIIEAKKNISTFYVNINRIGNNEDDYRDDDCEESEAIKELKSYKVVKQYEVRWEPRNKVEAFSHVRQFRMEYVPATGQLKIQSTVYSNNSNGIKAVDDSYSGTYNLGFNNSESILALRKKFATLYRMSREYRDEYIPRKRQEDATNHFCRLFPEIVDEILLLELPDEQEGNH